MVNMRKHIATLSCAVLVAGLLTILGAGVATAQTGNSVFRNATTNLCLDDSAEFGPRGFTCNGQNYQVWNLYRYNDGTYRIRNGNTGRCLQGSGAPAGQGGDTYFGVTGCVVSAQQSWILFTDSGRRILENEWTGNKLFMAGNGNVGITSLSSGNVFWRQSYV